MIRELKGVKFRSHIVKWFNVPRSSLRDATSVCVCALMLAAAIITISSLSLVQLWRLTRNWPFSSFVLISFGPNGTDKRIFFLCDSLMFRSFCAAMFHISTILSSSSFSIEKMSRSWNKHKFKREGNNRAILLLVSWRPRNPKLLLLFDWKTTGWTHVKPSYGS